MTRYPGIYAPRQVALLLESIPMLVIGSLLFANGLKDSVVWAVLVGSFLLMLAVTFPIVIGIAVRQEHRRQLESGWLTTLPTTYPLQRLGTSVERSRGEHRAVIGSGREKFESATTAVLAWQVKTRSGFRVIRVGSQGAFFSEAPVVGGECAVVRLGPIRETVTVVRVVRQPRVRGFAYGTLPEHPLRGEEAFLVEWHDDDRVELVIRSFSRPNGWVWWLLLPVLAIARRVFLKRYLRALLD
jgi:uncharacterized protein (UPF0548 family)